MRIKLNLLQLAPKKNPAVYWLHVDKSNILLIKQLKEKVQKVLKESRNIELYLDNVPFLDEDDVNAINANEEITVVIKNENIYEEANHSVIENRHLNHTNGSNVSGSPSSIEMLDFIPIKHTETTPSIVLPTNSKKRVRKRTHKKKPNLSEPADIFVNNCSGTSQIDTYVTTSNEPNKVHKRFKLDEEIAENNHQENVSKFSEEERLSVTSEVYQYNSSSLKPEKPNYSAQSIKKENSFKSKSKFNQVPVFVRGQKITQQTSTQNNSYTENFDDNTICSNSNKDYDLLVVDWKNMNQIKISNIAELEMHDLIQFKTLSMNENGEPQMSSVITARLEHIYKETLHIQVLSGMKEFMVLNSKFQVDDEEDTGTEREVQFGDIFEVVKLA